MADLCSLGELLIDFTPAGISEAGNALFERNPGGGPANVAAGAAALGMHPAFLGKVGRDGFGIFLKQTLDEKGVDTSGLVFSSDINTTLAFVHLNSGGDRSFSFYRKPGADMMYSEEDIAFDVIDSCEIFHFSSVSMTDMPVSAATRKAVSYAREKGKIISFDPNLRPPLWRDLSEARDVITSMMDYTDILKISAEELDFIFPDMGTEKAVQSLLDRGVKAVFATLGPGGCYFANYDGNGLLRTYDTKVADTTGCGDAFTAAVLYRINKRNGLELPLLRDEIADIADFANAAGACAATRRGGIPAMPSITDIENCRKIVPLL